MKEHFNSHRRLVERIMEGVEDFDTTPRQRAEYVVCNPEGFDQNMLYTAGVILCLVSIHGRDVYPLREKFRNTDTPPEKINAVASIARRNGIEHLL